VGCADQQHSDDGVGVGVGLPSSRENLRVAVGISCAKESLEDT
jgi:hypothetical protein